MQIRGSAALVSGGASGLGLAVAGALIARGAICTVIDLDADAGARALATLGPDARFVQADVTDEDAVRSAVERAGLDGDLRIAVTCAGIPSAGRVVSRAGQPHSLEAFHRVVAVNLAGTFNVMRLAAAAMTRNEEAADGERGVVVTTASIAGLEGQVGQIAYAASKAGVAGMTLPAARDLAAWGVRVLCVAPGTFDTPILETLSDDVRAALAAQVPFPRTLGEPEQFADLVVHLCENRYLNGDTIRIDGALRLPPAVTPRDHCPPARQSPHHKE